MSVSRSLFKAAIVDHSINDDDLGGAVVFLILSVAEEVCAIICGSLPVVIPQLFRRHERERSSQKTDRNDPTKLGAMPQRRSTIRGFQKLGKGPGGHTYEVQDLADWDSGSVPLNTVVAVTPLRTEEPRDALIVLKRKYEVTVEVSGPHAV